MYIHPQASGKYSTSLQPQSFVDLCEYRSRHKHRICIIMACTLMQPFRDCLTMHEVLRTKGPASGPAPATRPSALPSQVALHPQHWAYRLPTEKASLAKKLLHLVPHQARCNSISGQCKSLPDAFVNISGERDSTNAACGSIRGTHAPPNHSPLLCTSCCVLHVKHKHKLIIEHALGSSTCLSSDQRPSGPVVDSSSILLMATMSLATPSVLAS